DAASTDSLEALRFTVDVDRYLEGDASRAALLRARLASWCDNEPAFATVAKGHSLLEAALETSHNLAQLGRVGLAAMDAADSRKPLLQADMESARTLLSQLAREEAASKDLFAVSTSKQPPADLIIRVAPDVGRLVDATERYRGGN